MPNLDQGPEGTKKGAISCGLSFEAVKTEKRQHVFIELEET